MIEYEKYDWANWLIVRIMGYKQYVSYAVYAAEQVINIYETKYYSNDKPRKAIEAAKLCIDNPIKENKIELIKKTHGNLSILKLLFLTL